METKRLIEGTVYERSESLQFTVTEPSKRKFQEISRARKIHPSELFELAMDNLDHKTYHVSVLIDAARAERGRRIAQQLGYLSLESWIRASIEKGIDGFDLESIVGDG